MRGTRNTASSIYLYLRYVINVFPGLHASCQKHWPDFKTCIPDPCCIQAAQEYPHQALLGRLVIS
jgi:hypothetical protein